MSGPDRAGEAPAEVAGRPADAAGRPEVACRLGPEGLAERREQARRLRAAVEEVRELPDGLALRFPGDAAVILSLAEFVVAERRCCPFFAFTLDLEAGEGPAWLIARGPEGAKEFLREELLGGLPGDR